MGMMKRFTAEHWRDGEIVRVRSLKPRPVTCAETMLALTITTNIVDDRLPWGRFQPSYLCCVCIFSVISFSLYNNLCAR